MDTVVQTSSIAAPADAVWSRATSLEGITHELGPWLRMTVPRNAGDLSIDTIELGKPVGRSWILLFGVLPVDYDDLMLAEREPGRRFLERSSMLSLRTWEHERTVEPAGDGCTVTDRLSFELRGPLRHVPGSARLVSRIIGFLFDHRHKRLKGFFSARKGSDPVRAR